MDANFPNLCSCVNLRFKKQSGSQEGVAHDVERGGAAEPDFEGEGALVQEHREAIRGAGAGLVGGQEERSAAGGVNGIVNEVSRAEERDGDGRNAAELEGRGGHAQGGGVDDEIDVRELAGERGIVPRDGLEARHGAGNAGLAELRGELGCEGLGALEGAIDQDEAGAAFDGALDGDGPPGAAPCAQDEDAKIAEIDAEIGADGADEAGAVCAETEELAAINDDGIDAARAAGLRIDVVHEGERGGLVGDGHVCADEIAPGEKAQGLGQFLREDMEADVGGGDAGGGEGGIVHLRGARMGDGIAEHRETNGGRLGGPVAEIGEGVNVFWHGRAYRV